jgi:hypothetical protein
LNKSGCVDLNRFIALSSSGKLAGRRGHESIEEGAQLD